MATAIKKSLPLAFALIVIAGTAAADDFETCRNASGDTAIDACTRAIDSKSYNGHSLAVLYNDRGAERQKKGDLDLAIADYSDAISLDPKYTLALEFRGLAHIAKGDHDRAIADFNEAIRLNPKYVYAFSGRGNANEAKGDLDRAIADFSQAIQLDPEYAHAFYYRGNTYIKKGDFDRAIADYNDAIRLDPKYVRALINRGIASLYADALPKALADLDQSTALDPKNPLAALWRDIADGRSQHTSRLPQAIAQIDMTKWPAPLISLFLGQTTPANVLVAADNPDPKIKRSQLCEANFYIGELAIRQGAKQEAARLFRLAAGDCTKDSPEWFAANAELKALGASP